MNLRLANLWLRSVSLNCRRMFHLTLFLYMKLFIPDKFPINFFATCNLKLYTVNWFIESQAPDQLRMILPAWVWPSWGKFFFYTLKRSAKKICLLVKNGCLLLKMVNGTPVVDFVAGACKNNKIILFNCLEHNLISVCFPCHNLDFKSCLQIVHYLSNMIKLQKMHVIKSLSAVKVSLKFFTGGQLVFTKGKRFKLILLK